MTPGLNEVPPRARAVTVLVHLTLLIGLAAPVAHAGLYFFANQFPLFAPVQLPLGRLDLAVPLIPATIWIYLSDYTLVIGAFVLCRQPLRFTVSFLGVTAVAVLVQWLLPIEFPRALYPIEGTGLPSRALALLRELDGPGSCFPSLHVALTCMSVLEVQRAPPLRFPRLAVGVLAVWALAICLSTLTTKQHYAVDVAGGILLAVGVHGLSRAYRQGTPVVRRST